MMALYEIMMSSGALCLLQLAQGKPIRGGIDVGTGIEADGHLFGAAVVKAYRLESKTAQYARVAVGDTLVEYLDVASQSSGSDIRAEFERSIARQLRAIVAKDDDGSWMLDYLGPASKEIFGGTLPTDMVKMAEEFIEVSRNRWRQEDSKLFDLARYFDRRV